MSPVVALRAALEDDLSAFVGLLRRAGVPHRVVEQGNQLLLLVPDESIAEQVRSLHRGHTQNPIERSLQEPAAPVRKASHLWAALRASPLTAAMLLLTLAVFALTLGGENLAAVRWLSFVDVRWQADQVYLRYLDATLESGQWWRLISPVLLHFGWLHLAMNALWYWELGRRVEYRQGSLALLGLTLWFGLAANFAQYAWSGPSLFGGLSGVLYGLLGHCWLFQWLAPCAAYRLQRGVLLSLLIWLLVCMSGVFELLQFGAIANAAHVGGLLAGCGSGLLGGFVARRYQRP
jgi:GlpG protein